MKYRDIILPEELMPGEEYIERGKMAEEGYVEAYKTILSDCKEATASDAIYIIAKVNTEKLALTIGTSLSDHDKDVLMGVIERQIVKKVFFE